MSAIPSVAPIEERILRFDWLLIVFSVLPLSCSMNVDGRVSSPWSLAAELPQTLTRRCEVRELLANSTRSLSASLGHEQSATC